MPAAEHIEQQVVTSMEVTLFGPLPGEVHCRVRARSNAAATP